MAQPVYPSASLSTLPDQSSFRKEPAADPTIRTSLDDGALLVMAKATKVPWMWSFEYHDLSGTDKDTLVNFWSGSANFGAVVVKFTCPSSLTDYFVHFMEQPRCSLEDGGQQLWRVEVRLIEAIGTYT